MDVRPDQSEAEAPELQRLRRRVRQLERLLDSREQELSTVLNSHSFRLTAPLRWIRYRMQGSQSDVPAVPSRVEAVAAQDLPLHVRERDGDTDPNASHRVLDLDRAIAPLLPVSAKKRAAANAGPGSSSYRGWRSCPIRIVTLTSRELHEELSFDAEVTPVLADRWASELRPGAFDLLLIEAAWEPEGGWGIALASTEATRDRIGALIAHCRAVGLKVVLWAREDADNLDRIGWLAAEVDKTYAVDQRGVEWLRRNVPDADVGLLLPAVQPALYNPVRSYDLADCHEALRDVALLDGWWDLLGPWASNPVPAVLGDRLRVVDSRCDYSRVRLQDNPEAAARSLGVMTPLEKSGLLRAGASELFLPNGLSPDWRRTLSMLRAAASGAAIFWAGDRHDVPAVVPAESLRFTDADSIISDLSSLRSDPLAAARRVHLAMRNVLTDHCLADRLQQVSDDLGLELRIITEPPRVAHLLITMRPEMLPACLERFRRDSYPNRELVVVLHGQRDSHEAVRRMLKPGEPVTLLHAGRDRSLGDCLNLAIDHTSAPVWMKLDDDDHYGPAYTTDMMLYRRAMDVPLMGKPPMFLQLEQGDELRWDPLWASHANLLHHADEADAALVAGGTLTGKREVLESVRFSSRRRGGSDSDFIRRCYEHGHGLLATDGFNFARFRSAQAGFHTWQVPDQALRERSQLIGNRQALASQVFL